MGVHFIGLNFVNGSPRKISIQKAIKIQSAMQGKTLFVGIFRNQPTEEVEKIATDLNLDYLQLHGEESPQDCLKLSKPIIKAFSFVKQFDPAVIKHFQVNSYLFDAKSGNQIGGTGTSFDWKSIPSQKIFKPWFLAGGLGPDNLENALQTCSPWAVDLNSKIEISPGIKDLKKLERCLQIIQGN